MFIFMHTRKILVTLVINMNNFGRVICHLNNLLMHRDIYINVAKVGNSYVEFTSWAHVRNSLCRHAVIFIDGSVVGGYLYKASRLYQD